MELIRPKSEEFAPYFEGYINKVGDGNIIDILRNQKKTFIEFINRIPNNLEDYAYGEGKWTIKQMINHINDAERVFAFRAMALSRNEQNSIAGFDHNAYVEAVDVSNRSLLDLAEEFAAVRQSTILFFQNMPDAYAVRQGEVSQYNSSVRAIAYMIAGHVVHHQTILNERYL